MKNIFLDMPDFIERDPRYNRRMAIDGAYSVNAKVQFVRCSVGIPTQFISGKSVLDLGACVGAVGAWALTNGATKYVGVEIDSEFAKVAEENLTKYFPDAPWKILNQSLESFLGETNEKFDIVIALGVIYSSPNLNDLVKLLADAANEKIIVDSPKPLAPVAHQRLDINFDDLEILEIVDMKFMGRQIKSARPSIKFLSTVFSENKFLFEKDFTSDIIELLPNEYNNRYCVMYSNNKDIKTTGESVAEHYAANKTKVIPWKFDRTIAEDFVNHARHHIPGYDKIIDKSVDLCKMLLIPFHNKYRIIDVGCATGETLLRLSDAGFNHLVGVDNSDSMLDAARVRGVDKIADLILSDRLPVYSEKEYKAVICNWTLHFIKDKEQYLQDIYDSLDNNGILILTDKTYSTNPDLMLYHSFKVTQGVSKEEIEQKNASLVGVMFNNPPEWYLTTLRSIGFAHVSIVSAEYCFTTFLCIKNDIPISQ